MHSTLGEVIQGNWGVRVHMLSDPSFPMHTHKPIILHPQSHTLQPCQAAVSYVWHVTAAHLHSGWGRTRCIPCCTGSRSCRGSWCRCGHRFSRRSTRQCLRETKERQKLLRNTEAACSGDRRYHHHQWVTHWVTWLWCCKSPGLKGFPWTCALTSMKKLWPDRVGHNLWSCFNPNITFRALHCSNRLTWFFCDDYLMCQLFIHFPGLAINRHNILFQDNWPWRY